MLIVQKYGGSSVADKSRLLNAASRVAEEYKNGNSVVVVVSAQGDTTDDLIKAADDINPKASERELDMLLSTGEQQSASLMAMALNGMGLPAVSLNAWQMGILTSDSYGKAKIEKIASDRIKRELSDGNIVIAAGFQGINRKGDITTLGRGGSDTTAVALAAALNADKCEIYTDVEGVFTADPRHVENAVKLDNISYDEMLDYTTMGAAVLHNRSVEMAKKHDVKISVRSSFSDSEGTYVCGEKSFRLVSGIASDSNVLLVTVKGISDIKKECAVFALLAENDISVDIVMSRRDSGKLRFTVSSKDMAKTERALAGIDYEINDCLAKISVVGTGLETNPGVIASVYKALEEENVDMELMTTSEIKISVLIDKNDKDRLVKALHKKFFE